MEVMQEQHKDTKIGRIPKDWEVMQLNEITNYKSSNLSLNKLEENTGKYKLYGASGMLKGVDFYQTDKESFAIVKDGSGFGNLLWCDAYSSILGTLGRLSNNEFSDLKFCYYLTHIIKFKRYMSGSTIPHLYYKDYGKIKLAIPPLPEQQKIAAILSTVDEQISTTDKIIEKSKELKRGLMQKLFSEGIGHTEFKDTKIGRIPKDWRFLRFGEVFDFIKTSTHSKAQMTYDDTKSKIFNVHYGAIHTTYKEQMLDFNKYNVPKIADDSKLPTDNQFLKDGDVVIVDASEDAGGMGECVEIFNIGDRKVIGGLHTFAVRDKGDFFTKGFVGYIFKNSVSKNKLIAISNISKVYGVSKSNIVSVPLLIPTKEEQQKMASILSEVDVKIEKEQIQKSQLEKLKKGLMQQLLTGKKRVEV
jgi:type I restriction enzyme, S subunit